MSTLTLIGDVSAILICILIFGGAIYICCVPSVRRRLLAYFSTDDDLSEVVIGNRKKDDDLGKVRMKQDEEMKSGILGSTLHNPGSSTSEAEQRESASSTSASSHPNNSQGIKGFSNCDNDYYQAGRVGLFGSGSGSGINEERIAALRAKLEEATAEKRKEQEEYYDNLKKEMKVKHEEEMKERESRFKGIVEEKWRAEKEDFLSWTTIPD